MKKVLSVIAVSAFVMTAGVAVAGGPGKKKDAACPEACQQQIDDLQSSQAQQNEQLGSHGKQLENHEGRITALEKNAYDPWFVRVGVRAAWANMNTDGFWGDDTDTDAGFGAALAFGREFGQFRVEGELAYQGADIDTINNASVADGDYDLTTVMVNGYYELPVYDAFSVYAMAGVGIAKLSVDTGVGGFDDSDQAFAYKAGVGMTYNFTEEIAADLGYEYLGVADTDVADSFTGHNVVGSVRFKF
jgi:opacity protein-like surface antigen